MDWKFYLSAVLTTIVCVALTLVGFALKSFFLTLFILPSAVLIIALASMIFTFILRLFSRRISDKIR